MKNDLQKDNIPQIPGQYAPTSGTDGLMVKSWKILRPAIVMLVGFALLTGIVYPMLVTGVAQLVFPWRANGSLLQAGGKTVGSTLIGQPFTDPKYFWSRISATSPFAYNAASSTGSNLGPTNPALLDQAKSRIRQLKSADSLNTALVPADLATSSSSGLDPHISIAAAIYQIPRVARARAMSTDQVRTLVDKYTEGRMLGIFGEPRVNVLELNLALDGVQTTTQEN